MAEKKKEKSFYDDTKPRTTGRGGNSNFNSSLVGAKSEDISRCLGNCLTFYDRPIVKSDEECRERLLEFFTTCYNTGQLPTVEKMIMALGCVKSTAWEWEHGIKCSPERANLIKKAKETIATFESEMVTEGKINPVVYIFRAKNYFGMSDETKVVVTPQNPLGDLPDQKALEERIAADVIVDNVPED